MIRHFNSTTVYNLHTGKCRVPSNDIVIVIVLFYAPFHVTVHRSGDLWAGKRVWQSFILVRKLYQQSSTSF